MRQVNIVLSAEDVDHLVRGGELNTESNGVRVNMIMSDIGYGKVAQIVADSFQSDSRVNEKRKFSQAKYTGD